MAQKENFFEDVNREDRRKISKYEIGDLIVQHTVRWDKKIIGSRRFFIYDKRKIRDKKGEMWVYDIFYPDNNDVRTDIRLIDTGIFKYEAVA